MSPLFHFGEHLAVPLVQIRHTSPEPSHVTAGGLVTWTSKTQSVSEKWGTTMKKSMKNYEMLKNSGNQHIFPHNLVGFLFLILYPAPSSFSSSSAASPSHTHTPLCHTPSFTHNFVTRHFVTYNFVTHHLPHLAHLGPLVAHSAAALLRGRHGTWRHPCCK